ncbi:hypothetical protein [Porphyromonas sp.]
MKLKYIFTLLGVMLLGLTSCGKKDAPKTESNNPFAGTQWEYIQSTAKEQGESEILTATIDFTDDSHFSFQTSYKVTAKDGTIKKSRETNKVNGTYTNNGLVATATATTVNKDEQKTTKLILTMDETKQKLTAVSSPEGEKEQTATFTRKK